MTGFRISLGLALIAAAGSAGAETLWTAEGFDMPESALVDAVRDRIVLSEIAGAPGAADGVGGLALLSLDGEVLERDWVTGLDAPKGLALVGDTLLVADLTRLHVIDAASGEILRSLPAPGAVFLNDVTSDGEVAYISDLMADSIWRYAEGALSLWMQDPALNHPNGLLRDGDRLLVGSWGAGLHPDLSTDAPGALLSVALDTQEITELVPALGNLDGIARVGGELLVNDWVGGQLYRVDDANAAHLLAEHPSGLADISGYEGTLFLPQMLDGTLTAQRHR